MLKFSVKADGFDALQDAAPHGEQVHGSWPK